MAPHTMDRHQHKRAYQPQITSFFSRASPDDVLAAAETVSTPALAPAVQASLLSVGMRIRKSVPEGYKTHKTKLFDDVAVTPSFLSTGDMMDEDKENEGYSRPRELQPFCSIHRVGGLSVQDSVIGAVNGYGLGRANNSFGDDFISSQESNTSVQGQEGVERWLSTGKNKRRLDDDGSDADDEQESFAFDLAPSPHVMGAKFPGRFFAKPRSRRRRSQLQAYTSTIAYGDFEEAGFLQPWDEGEMQIG